MESVSKNTILHLVKNDEKSSRKKYFEITPCLKMVIFVTEFFILVLTKVKLLPYLQDFLLFLAPPKLWTFRRSCLSKVNAMEDENIHLQLLPFAQ